MTRVYRNRVLFVVAVAVAVLGVRAAAAATVDEDFAARCAAPGVVLCKGLDTESDLQTGEIGNASDGTRQSSVDTSQKASGGGSMKFTLRAGNSSQNIGGYWSTDLGRKFVSGDTIYVQYRWRATPAYFSNNRSYWRSSVKQINIHGPSSTCQGSEFTTILESDRISMYTNCGDGWFTDVNTNARLSSCTGACLIQQGSSTVASPNGSGYNCNYQNQFAGDGTGSGCYEPAADTWYTHYEVIKLGTWGGSNSSVAAYETHGGSGYKQFHRVDGVRWNNNRDDNFTRLRFETYMTEIAAAAPTAAHIWYDELIVSTQPIAAPGKTATVTTPNPPIDVKAQ